MGHTAMKRINNIVTITEVIVYLAVLQRFQGFHREGSRLKMFVDNLRFLTYVLRLFYGF